jgi:hypothetical protein
VHYYDAHAYWDPPAPYSEQYPLTYDGEIAFVDAQVGRLIQAVGRGGRETVVVVVGDHGEALGEHGEGTHGVLVQEATLRIPLIVHAPGGLEGGVHVPTRVSQIDLMPTLLSLLGRPVPLDLDGVDLALAPDPERAIYAENLEARLQYGWARLAALYRGSLKFVDGPSPELYDLGVDPLEHDDVAAARGAEIAALRDRMRALQALADDRLQPSTALEPADVRRLRALGYVVGAGHVVQASGPGPDPGEWLPLLGQLQALLSISRTPLPAWATLLGRLSGRPMPSGDAELTAAYEAIAERYPDFAPVYSYLIDLYKAAGRGRDADRAQERLTQAVQAASAGS